MVRPPTPLSVVARGRNVQATTIRNTDEREPPHHHTLHRSTLSLDLAHDLRCSNILLKRSFTLPLLSPCLPRPSARRVNDYRRCMARRSWLKSKHSWSWYTSFRRDTFARSRTRANARFCSGSLITGRSSDAEILLHLVSVSLCHNGI